MKKILLNKPVVEKKNIEDNIQTIYDEKTQLDFIRKMYMKEDFEENATLQKAIKQKLSSYRMQDIKKKRYDESQFITYEQSIEKILISKLHCFYCKKKMLLCYKNIREPLQWTLDRYDNNIGHYDSNVCVCCLKCNLQRRVKSVDHFKFTKQLKIQKL